jgi:hypothetical protein
MLRCNGIAAAACQAPGWGTLCGESRRAIGALLYVRRIEKLLM